MAYEKVLLLCLFHVVPVAMNWLFCFMKADLAATNRPFASSLFDR